MSPSRQAWAISDYGPIDSLALIDRPVPTPGAGEMLVEVDAVALNPLDLKIMAGRMKEVMPATMPYTPGSDLAGRVVGVGEGIDTARVGDRVVASTFSGALARTCLLPASAHVVTAPPEASATDLAALPMAGLTALDILRHVGEIDGRTLAILGAAGGVGLALARMAADRGARVIASAKPADAEIVRLNGATEVVDYTASDFIEGLRAQHPPGVDLLVDLVSMFDALLRSAEAVRDGGTLVSSLFGPPLEAFGARIHVVYERLAAQPGDLRAVIDAYLAGRLRANVTRTFRFAETPAAYRALRDDHVSGKFVVTL